MARLTSLQRSSPSAARTPPVPLGTVTCTLVYTGRWPFGTNSRVDPPTIFQAPGLPPVAARFELYLDGIELANGFHELADSSEQRDRFARDLAIRRKRGQAQPPVDERLLAALAAGIPDCSGVALGFDRLVAIALKATSLSQAMAFSIDSA